MPLKITVRRQYTIIYDSLNGNLSYNKPTVVFYTSDHLIVTGLGL